MNYRPSKMDREVFHLELPYIKLQYELNRYPTNVEKWASA
jgi:hypothetical protein